MFKNTLSLAGLVRRMYKEVKINNVNEKEDEWKFQE
jgi:hypothetical protein